MVDQTKFKILYFLLVEELPVLLSDLYWRKSKHAHDNDMHRSTVFLDLTVFNTMHHLLNETLLNFVC